MRILKAVALGAAIGTVIGLSLLFQVSQAFAQNEEYDLYVYTRESPNDQVYIGRHLDLPSCLSQLARAQTNVDTQINIKLAMELRGEVYKSECHSLDTGRIETISIQMARQVSYPIFRGCAWTNTPPCKW